VGWGSRWLNRQGLTGTIPTNVGLLTSLTRLYASYHTPPACHVERWWGLTWKGWFARYLIRNNLTGTIPTTVGLMTSMASLYSSYHTPPCVSR
jgi:hypothetical protein